MPSMTVSTVFNQNSIRITENSLLNQKFIVCMIDCSPFVAQLPTANALLLQVAFAAIQASLCLVAAHAHCAIQVLWSSFAMYAL